MLVVYYYSMHTCHLDRMYYRLYCTRSRSYQVPFEIADRVQRTFVAFVEWVKLNSLTIAIDNDLVRLSSNTENKLYLYTWTCHFCVIFCHFFSFFGHVLLGLQLWQVLQLILNHLPHKRQITLLVSEYVMRFFENFVCNLVSNYNFYWLLYRVL